MMKKTKKVLGVVPATIIGACCVLFATAVFSQIPIQITDHVLSVEHNVRVAELNARDLLAAQIDEQAGVRGYMITREKLFLEPYNLSKKKFENLVWTLERDTNQLGIKSDLSLAILNENREWVHEVAEPLIKNNENAEALLRKGEKKIDRIRSQMTEIESHLGERAFQAENEARHHTFMLVWLSSVAFSICLIGAVVFFIVEINSRRENESRLASMAEHDALTMLYNRRGFEKRLTAAMNGGRASDSVFSVAFLDLDRFKQINDIYGHEVGDVVLRVVAERLMAVARSTDTVARIGGDEFAIIMPGSPNHSIIERIRESVARPIPIGNLDLSVGISVGIASHPAEGPTATDLMRNADDAMYADKKRIKERTSLDGLAKTQLSR